MVVCNIFRNVECSVAALLDEDKKASQPLLVSPVCSGSSATFLFSMFGLEFLKKKAYYGFSKGSKIGTMFGGT